MKHILIASLIILLPANVIFAMPDYNPAQRNMKVVYTGVEEAKYNKALYDRLYNVFIKKYTDKNGNFSPPVNAYAVEVLEEFNRLKIEY